MMYNWEHKDLIVTLTMRKSNATFMYAKTGQTDFENNIFTALPFKTIMAEKN